VKRGEPLPIATYEPRLTRGLGARERAGWTIKLTGISAGSELPGEPEIAAGVDAAEKHLPTVDGLPGAAFLILHAGTEALWGILGWWHLDILYQRTLRAALGTTSFVLVPPDGPTACVWELLVVDHERRSWVEHVLSHPDSPDYPAYIADSGWPVKR